MKMEIRYEKFAEFWKGIPWKGMTHFSVHAKSVHVCEDRYRFTKHICYTTLSEGYQFADNDKYFHK